MARIEIENIKSFRLPIPDELRTAEPPGPSATAIFENGTGRRVTKPISLESLEEVAPIQKLIEETEDLWVKLRKIPREIIGVSQRKTDNHGRPIPERRRKKIINALQKEKKGLPDRIADKTQRLDHLRSKLSEVVSASDPLFPLTIEVDGDVNVINGEPLTDAGRDWLKYVERKGPEGPWGFVVEEENGLYCAIRQYYEARMELALASMEADGTRETQAEREFEDVRRELDRIAEDESLKDEYLKIEPFIFEINRDIARRKKLGQI